MRQPLPMFKLGYKTMIGAAAVAILGLSSCQKEAMQVRDFFATESEAESSSSELGSSEEVDMISLHKGGPDLEALADLECNPLDQLPECATVTESGPTFPKTITIDFGTGCEDHHGRAKQGKIIIELTAEMDEEGAVRTVTFDEFKIGEVSIEGARTLENKGFNAAGNYMFEKTVQTTHNGPRGIMERSFVGEIEMISGFETGDCNKVFYLSGKGSMTGPRGAHTRTITTPLLIDRNCKHPLSGVVEMTGREDVTIDFGEGECDSKAMVTKEGETNEIDLDEMKVHCKRGPREKE